MASALTSPLNKATTHGASARMILPDSTRLLFSLLTCLVSHTLSAPASANTDASPVLGLTPVATNETGQSLLNVTAWPPVPYRERLPMGELVITNLGENCNQAEKNVIANVLAMLQSRLETLNHGNTFYFLSPRVLMSGLASLAFSASIEPTAGAPTSNNLLDPAITALHFMIGNFGLRELRAEIDNNPDVRESFLKVEKGRKTRFASGYDHLFAALPSRPGIMLEFREGPTPLLPSAPDKTFLVALTNDFISHVSNLDPNAGYVTYSSQATYRGFYYGFGLQTGPNRFTNEIAVSIAQDVQQIISGFPPASFGAEIRQLIGEDMEVIGGVHFDRGQQPSDINNGTEGVIFA